MSIKKQNRQLSAHSDTVFDLQVLFNYPKRNKKILEMEKY